jgi:hypothetical protein
MILLLLFLLATGARAQETTPMYYLDEGDTFKLNMTFVDTGGKTVAVSSYCVSVDDYLTATRLYGQICPAVTSDGEEELVVNASATRIIDETLGYEDKELTVTFIYWKGTGASSTAFTGQKKVLLRVANSKSIYVAVNASPTPTGGASNPPWVAVPFNNPTPTPR